MTQAAVTEAINTLMHLVKEGENDSIKLQAAQTILAHSKDEASK